MTEKIEPERVHELTESIVKDYLKSQGQSPKDIICVDIEGLITDKYGYRIAYETFAEEGGDKIAFSANGTRPLKVVRQGNVVERVFSDKTIVLDKTYRNPSSSAAKRFILAHELGHKIYAKVSVNHSSGCYRVVFDKERLYSLEELKEQFDIREIEANRFGCGLLMPRFLLVNTIRRIFGKNKITVYGERQLLPEDVLRVKQMVDDLGVTSNMLYFQLKEENLLNYRPMEEFLKLTGLAGVS